MNTGNFSPALPSNPENEAAGDEQTVVHASDSSQRLDFEAVGLTEEGVRVSSEAIRSVDIRSSDDTNESRILKLENEETGLGDASGGALENQPCSSVSGRQSSSEKKTDLRNGKSEHKKVKGAGEDYDSLLSAFDEFASKGAGEAVGYGYEIGDMVWGKVKSHPWWPGHIYNEAFASPSVRRSKREGHVLVAFFGDSSYGWFDPAELVPFEQNFTEKSQQTFSRAFSKAVEEAVDELSRRRSLGVSCRCRNEFNFWPSGVEGYFFVDVGDPEPGVYSLSQINKARESFCPKEMLYFVQQLALAPMTDQYWTIEFLQNKATVLACRKALFEEFDETYAQAFGTVPVRPPRPTAPPVAVDPSKGFSAPLSGRLVIAETLGKGKNIIKSIKTKDQMEKDKYLFKRRDEPVHVKNKKASQGQVVRSGHPLSLDGGFSGSVHSGMNYQMHQSSASGAIDSQHQAKSIQAPMVSDTRPSEGSRKLVGGEIKKVKAHKRPAGELSTEDAAVVEKKKKKKKGISTESSSRQLIAEKRRAEMEDLVQSPVVVSSSVALERVPVVLPDITCSVDKLLADQQRDSLVGSSLHSLEGQREVGQKGELSQLVRDLRALALDPFHGEGRGFSASVRLAFLKYRSLVYQKSLVLSPPTEIETSEAQSSTVPAATATAPADVNNKTPVKVMKPSFRPDDPTKGGRKRVSSDRPEAFKKKKLDSSEDFQKKQKLIDSQEIKKKKQLIHTDESKKKLIDVPKLLAVEKKNPQRPMELQRGDVKESAAKNVLRKPPKAVKLETSKRVEQPVSGPRRTMLVMKFPAGAALPSGAELRAKFARFGPMDHSATRVFWQTHTCRLVFHRKADADAACNFAASNLNNVFGNTNVKCYTRPQGADAAESEPVKVPKEDTSSGPSQPREPAVEQRLAMKIGGVQPHQQSSVQLKSCLKKPSGEEGGNGNGRGTRVKFMGVGEGSNKTEQVSSFAEGASSSSYTHSTPDVASKNLPKFLPTATTQFQKIPINMPRAELPPPPPPTSFNVPPAKDISQELLNLLTRCRDVVNSVTGALGYAPYHPL